MSLHHIHCARCDTLAASYTGDIRPGQPIYAKHFYYHDGTQPSKGQAVMWACPKCGATLYMAPGLVKIKKPIRGVVPASSGSRAKSRPT